jgi:OFA family oxalate/formate antiporter-like MFS transporter
LASQAASSSGGGNRVVIAIAGVVMQVALGAVYAWSVFREPLTQAYGGASVTAVNFAFSITILTLGFAAFAGGLWMARSGPRTVALTAGVLYGLGVFLASFADNSLTLLYLTYGFIAGAGIGLGLHRSGRHAHQVVPGQAGLYNGHRRRRLRRRRLRYRVRGKVPRCRLRVFSAFAILGVIYLVMVVGAALFMKNPPEGWKPAGGSPRSPRAATAPA